MSEGPFQPEDFKNMDWENDLPVRESAAKEANLHPFVKEARELAEMFSRFEIHFKSEGGIYRPGLGYTKMETLSEGRNNPAKAFLSKYFPEKESGG
jgi:hypothetical protein